MPLRLLLPLLLTVLAAGCALPLPAAPSAHHLQAPARPPGAAPIPPLSATRLPLPAPRSAARTDTYSIVVARVDIQDLLFALARDARLNLDLHPGLAGTVTLNAIGQTLPQLLGRLARQVDMRYEFDGQTLLVMPDTPVLRSYLIDYVNLSRNVSGTVSTNTQIATSSTLPNAGASATAPGNGGNVSATRIENASRNQFWDSLEKNLRDLLRETDKLLPEGSSETVIENQESSTSTGSLPLPAVPPAGRARNRPPPLVSAPGATHNSATTVVNKITFHEAASVIANRESGVLSIRASGRQHERIREFLERVTAAARRQVLIEATIVEVSLADTYRQGIDWSRVLASGTRFGLTGPTLGSSAANTASPFGLSYRSAGGIDATVRLLEGFGTVKVLSSPKLAVLNNQTAAIKVVEEFVYFNVKADTTQTTNAGALTTVTTTPQAVSVGLVMTVTAEISDDDEVILNVRPTISSISDFRRDPNPNIPAAVANLVPQIRTREIESILRVANGEIAILGGLMEDRIDYRNARVPLLGAVPLLGELFTQRDNAIQKTELVIFLRPQVLREARLVATTPALRELLPDEGFFNSRPPPGERNFAPSRDAAEHAR